MGHPQGVRPFGYWIPGEFEHLAGTEWRRISGTRQEPWTFHTGIGLWGGSNIPWEARAKAKPRYTLFLASSWNLLTEGRFQKSFFSLPEPCKNRLAYRDMRWCGSLL